MLHTRRGRGNHLLHQRVQLPVHQLPRKVRTQLPVHQHVIQIPRLVGKHDPILHLHFLMKLCAWPFLVLDYNRSGTDSNDPVPLQSVYLAQFREETVHTEPMEVILPQPSPRKKIGLKKKLTPKKLSIVPAYPASPASPASNTRSKKKVGFKWKPPVFSCYFGDLAAKTTAALLSLYFGMTVM